MVLDIISTVISATAPPLLSAGVSMPNMWFSHPPTSSASTGAGLACLSVLLQSLM